MRSFYAFSLFFSFLSAQVYDLSIPENDTATYNYADFRIWLADSIDEFHGIYWFMHHNNGDSRDIVYDEGLREVSSRNNFILMGAHIYNMHMNSGIGDAVIAAMDSFAVISGHPEIENTPFFINGYSWGGQFGYHFTKWIPERVIGFITQKGGYHDTTHAGSAIEVPGYMFVAEDDLPYRIENLTGIFEDHRPLGAKWILAMEQGATHTEITDWNLLNTYFETVTDLRLPENLDMSQTVPLNILSDTIAWLGDRTTWEIGSWECYNDSVDSACWFLSRTVGEQWQTFVSEELETDTIACDLIYDSTYVYFTVGIHGADDGSNYVVATDNDELINQCREQLELPEEERVLHVNGSLDYGNGGFNQPWSWHIVPNEWVLAEMSIGVCNAPPEDVENNIDYWVNNVGQLCNWSSYIKDEIAGDMEGTWAWINGGYQSGIYTIGDTIHIWSDMDPGTTTFQAWTGDTSLLFDPSEWHTTFTMPDGDVQLFAHQETVGPLIFDYELIQGVENPKNVYYKFPEGPSAIIFFFHGGNGNAEEIIERVEVVQFFQHAFEKGFGLIITESEDRTLGDPDNDGTTKWKINSWTVDSNIDIGNIQALIDTFTVRGNMDQESPIYSVGVSNGGNFSSIVAHALNLNAAAMYSSQGNPPEFYQLTDTPTIFCPAKYDPALGGGNWAAHMNFDTLQSRGIPSVFYELDRSPAYPQRFARIPGIDISLSNEIFNEFQSMGFIDNNHYFVVLDDSIQHQYMTNPDMFSVLSTLNISTVRHILDQIKVMTADHSFFADFNQRVLTFFIEHSNGTDFWQQEEIPQGYKYMMGSAPDGQVLAAGTNPNGGTLSLYYSGDEGSSWTILPIPNNPAPTIQDVVLSSDGQIYLADLAYGVFYSDNYGQTWTDIGEFTPEGCASFGLHSSGVIFAGLTYTGIGYIHRSENNGATWEAIPLPDYNSNYAVEHIQFNSQGHIFLGTINGVYRSTDMGQTWQQCNADLNGIQIYTMTITDQDHIYVLTTLPGSFDGYYRSTDNGNSWEALDWVQDIDHALDIIGVGGCIYVINDQTIMLSDDEGQAWSEISTGLNPDEMYFIGGDLELTPSGYLYAGAKYVHRSIHEVSTTILDIAQINLPEGSNFKLYPAYPNPFNPMTKLHYDLPENDRVTITIYDMVGRVVKNIMNMNQTAGYHSIRWNATNYAGQPVPAGPYFYSIEAGNFRQTRKIMLLK